MIQLNAALFTSSEIIKIKFNEKDKAQISFVNERLNIKIAVTNDSASSYRMMDVLPIEKNKATWEHQRKEGIQNTIVLIR